jgi:hypothetical protein
VAWTQQDFRGHERDYSRCALAKQGPSAAESLRITNADTPQRLSERSSIEIKSDLHRDPASRAIDSMLSGRRSGRPGWQCLCLEWHCVRLTVFVPAIGDVFTVVTASAVTGTFKTTNLPSLSGAHWVVSYNANNVTLTVASGT